MQTPLNYYRYAQAIRQIALLLGDAAADHRWQRRQLLRRRQRLRQVAGARNVIVADADRNLHHHIALLPVTLASRAHDDVGQFQVATLVGGDDALFLCVVNNVLQIRPPGDDVAL